MTVATNVSLFKEFSEFELIYIFGKEYEVIKYTFDIPTAQCHVLFSKYNFFNEVVRTKYFIHQRPHAMNVFIADLNKNRSALVAGRVPR